MAYKTLADMGDIAGKPVLVRLDFNVPVEDGEVVDDYRIRKSLPTISFLKQKGAKTIIVAHIEGKTDTLKPVYERLRKGAPVLFCEDLENAQACIDAMEAGDVLLCENLRLYDGEKKNDPDFAKKLAALAEYYVNDAFSVSHRKHASIVGVPKLLPSFMGLQFEEEIKNLSRCFSPEHPFLFILGGAKFDTKMPLVEKFLDLADSLFIGGALSNDILKAKGFGIGQSTSSDSSLDLSRIASASKVIVPIDVVVSSPAGSHERLATAIEEDEKIVDAGARTLAMLEEKVREAKFVLWNGPLGQYESGYAEPTKKLAEMIAESGAMSIVGGGDTVAAIAELGIEDKLGFVSTGGGAMLDYLAEGTIPGLAALDS